MKRATELCADFERRAIDLVVKRTKIAGVGLATLYRDSQYEIEARGITDPEERALTRAVWNATFELELALKFPNHPRTLIRQKASK